MQTDTRTAKMMMHEITMKFPYNLLVINVCRLKRRVIRQMYMTTLGKFQSDSGSGRRVQATGTVQNAGDETKPLLSGGLW